SPALRRYAEQSLPHVMAFTADGTVWLLNHDEEPLLKFDKSVGRWRKTWRSMAALKVVTRVRLYGEQAPPWTDFDVFDFLKRLLLALRSNEISEPPSNGPAVLRKKKPAQQQAGRR